MSYILDALKRSQRQRQAHETPKTSSVAPTAATDDMDERAIRKANALWLLVAFAAIIAMVIGLGVAINQATPSNTVPDAQLSTTQSAHSNTTQTQADTHIQSSNGVNNHEPSTIDDVSSESTPKVASRQTIPKEVLARVPDLNITGHIFSTQASMRRVTINGQNWIPGEWLSDDVQLHSITATGITLELGGRWRLDVSRSRGWQARN